MEENIIATETKQNQGGKVCCTYADIYFDDECVQSKELTANEKPTIEMRQKEIPVANLWHSPSDVLAKLVELQPPYTSRVKKGKTHEGILEFGKEVMEKELSRFNCYVDNLKEDSDAAWGVIQKHEKETVEKKIKDIHDKILLEKFQIMHTEISNYFEQSLQGLEAHLKDEVETVSIKIAATITTDLNIEIQKRLKEHKSNLNKILKQKYDSAVNRLKTYYKLLLNNEKCKSNKEINKALHERNDALKAFYEEIEADKITSTMYVMCVERKKCKVKQFLLKSYHNKEMTETLLALREKQELLEQFPKHSLSKLNLEWQEKIKKVIRLFLKFISFSLKLLPEQATFLLDLEKIIILQLNEIQKNPVTTSSVLVDAVEVNNVFKFEKYEKDGNICAGDPFVIETGHVPEEIKDGSQDIFTLDRELPYIRVQRQFIYAKCQKIEEVLELLNSQQCKCKEVFIHPVHPPEPAATPEPVLKSSSPTPASTTNVTTHPTPYYFDTPLSSNIFSVYSMDQTAKSSSLHKENEIFILDKAPSECLGETSSFILDKPPSECLGETSSKETYVIEDFHRLQDCPGKTCKRLNWNSTFQDDFDEENYRRANIILDEISSYKAKSPPKLISSEYILGDTLPFAATPFHLNVGVQYSTADLASDTPVIQHQWPCSCGHTPIYSAADIDEALDKRKKSLIRLIKEHPSLLKILALDL